MNGHGCVLIKLSLREGVRAKVDCQTWAEMTTEMRLLTFTEDWENTAYPRNRRNCGFAGLNDWKGRVRELRLSKTWCMQFIILMVFFSLG